MTPVECPDWVPDAVREEAKELLEHGLMDHEPAIVLRMATAPEMRAVWRRLEKCSPGRGGDPDWPELGIPRSANSPDSDRDAALRYFFRIACRDLWPLDLGRLATEAEQYRRLADELREAAASWGWEKVEDPEDDEEWEALLAAAEVLEGKAITFATRLLCAPGERLRGQNRERDYAVRLADECVFAFPDDQIPSSLIATVTSVYFNRTDHTRVTHKHVQHWLKADAKQQSGK